MIGETETAPQTPPRLALVLGAGGMRGVAHIGVLQALEGLGTWPDALVGTSSGALVAACHAALGWPPDRMARAAVEMGRLAFFSIALRDRIPTSLLPTRARAARGPGAILAALEAGSFEQLREGVACLGITCFDLVSGQEKFFHTGQGSGRPTLVEAVAGSASLPLLSGTKVRTDDGVRMTLVDGGYWRTLPVQRALDPPVSARRALVVDLGVATGWSERPLDYPARLRRRYGERLRIVRPDVARFGTAWLRQGEASRLIDAGRRAIDSDVTAWLVS